MRESGSRWYCLKIKVNTEFLSLDLLFILSLKKSTGNSQGLIHLAYVWHTFGIRLAYVWHTFGGSQGGLVVINRASHLCDPGSTLAQIVCGLSFSRSQSDSEGFSPGTPVFLPHQNWLPAYSIRLWCCAPRTWVVFRGRAPSRLHSSFGPTSLSCALVRALASHQCGPGLIPGLGVICGLSLLVLYSAPRGFLRALRFPLASKTNIWLDLLSLFISVYSVPN